MTAPVPPGGSTPGNLDPAPPDTTTPGPAGTPPVSDPGPVGLPQTFRAGQSTLGTATAGAVRALWARDFSISEARASWGDIRPVLLRIVASRWQVSAAAGLRYYNASRIQAGLPPLVKIRIPQPDEEHIGNVIDSTGLGAFLHQVKGGAQMLDAFDSAQQSLSAAISRLVLSGGRDTVTQASIQDPDAEGWKRVTSGTCEFCAQLSEAGVQVDSSDFPAHDHCECTAEPAFRGPNLSGLMPSADTTAAEYAPEINQITSAPGLTTRQKALAQINKRVGSVSLPSTRRK